MRGCPVFEVLCCVTGATGILSIRKNFLIEIDIFETITFLNTRKFKTPYLYLSVRISA